MNFYRTGCLAVLLSTISFFAQAQNYHATNGSAYAGAAGLFNNPASGVNSVYKWDLNLFSFQSTLTTNNISLSNFTYSNPNNAYVSFNTGANSYYAHQNLDANLFNFLYKIDEKHAFGIGLRGRMYNHFKSSPIFANDTISSAYSFFRANRTTPNFNEFMTHNGWLELNLNYSQVIAETERTRLTGGITLNISKALSGFNAKINKISFQELFTPDTTYLITQGGVGLAYSNNYDLPSQSTFKDLIKNSSKGFGINLGLEYTIYDYSVSADNIQTPTNYSWKLGFSLMDLGKNTFNTSRNSGNYYNPASNLTDSSIASKLSNPTSINQIRDSLATMFTSYDSIANTFTISRPTRIILNVDKNLGNHFAVNAQMNINFYSSASYNKILTREINLLTITPRWETIAWGFFLPIQYNTQGNVWIGAAIKLGPLTVGLHNIAWVKSPKDLNGGGYLMLSLHPFNSRKIMSRFDCPK